MRSNNNDQSTVQNDMLRDKTGKIVPVDASHEEMTPAEQKCREAAQYLHGNVRYGGNLNMYNQIKAVVDWCFTFRSDVPAPDFETVVCAALLHKCWERKRIEAGKEPLTEEQIIALCGNKGRQVLAVVSELASEPKEDKTQSLTKRWEEKASWGAGLSREAQFILCAEKAANFVTSRDNPNKEWPMQRHIDYVDSRMIFIDTIAPVFPKMYDTISMLAQETVETIEQKLNVNGPVRLSSQPTIPTHVQEEKAKDNATKVNG